jgi:hypothetical protein
VQDHARHADPRQTSRGSGRTSGWPRHPIVRWTSRPQWSDSSCCSRLGKRVATTSGASQA